VAGILDDTIYCRSGIIGELDVLTFVR